MTIQEAIKSERSFRRSSWDRCMFCRVERSNFLYLNVAGKETQVARLSIEEICATDWEVVEEKIEITREQLNKAWDETMHPLNVQGGSITIMNHENSYRLQLLAKELGFKS